MKLEEFEALEKAATPGTWCWEDGQLESEVGEGRILNCAVGFLPLHDDAAFIAASREMVPNLIRALLAARHCVRALDDDSAILPGSALHKLLRGMSFDEFGEQP